MCTTKFISLHVRSYISKVITTFCNYICKLLNVVFVAKRRISTHIPLDDVGVQRNMEFTVQ